MASGYFGINTVDNPPSKRPFGEKSKSDDPNAAKSSKSKSTQPDTQARVLTLDDIKKRLKDVKSKEINYVRLKEYSSQPDKDRFSYARKARELKDNTLTNNSRLIMKILEDNKKTNTPIWRDLGRVKSWLDSKGFSDATKRNYLSLLLEMNFWDIEIGEKTVFNYNQGETDTVSNQSVDGQGGSQGVNLTIRRLARYKFLIETLEKRIQEKKGKREVSEKKKEQQVAPSVVTAMIDKMKEDGHVEEALIVQILMTYPYRAEVGSLDYVTLKSYNKLVKDAGGKENLKGNYLVVGSRGKMFVSRSAYKTFVNYGTIVNDIEDKKLKSAIHKYIREQKPAPNTPMFPSMTSNQDVSKKLNYLTKKYTGISLGPAALVKIMLSSAPFKDLADAADYLKEMSRIRGTALSTLQDVYLHSKALED